MSQVRETSADLRNRAMRPGEIRTYRVPLSSVDVSVQRTDNGQGYVVMVARSGVLVDELRASFDSQMAAGLLARAYIALERTGSYGVAAVLREPM